MRLIVVAVSIVIASLLVASIAAAGQPGFNCYFGNLHSHTSYSDGVLTPSDAFVHARDMAGMDFMAVTEHGYYLQDATNVHLWYKSLEEADQYYEPGRFVTLVGYEWTHSSGHANGFATPTAASRDTQTTFLSFVEFLRDHNGIGMFNHPDPAMQPNWDDFSYFALADRYISLIEVGSGPYARNTRHEKSYVKALDRGWKVGAVNNQDNHRADWGTAADTRTGLLAMELTRESVYEAMRSMRTYSTEDRNIQVRFWSGDIPMGGTILLSGQAGSWDPVDLVLECIDPDPDDAITTVQIITNRGQVVKEWGGLSTNAASLNLTVHPFDSYNWYYARIVQADGDAIVTSPIWVQSETNMAVYDLGCQSLTPTAARPTRVSAEIVNRQERSRVVDARLYAVSSGVRTIIGFQRVDMAAGKGNEVSFGWIPDSSGEHVLVLEISCDGAIDMFTSDRFNVHSTHMPVVMIDEGHNNRYGGYYSEFVKDLASLGVEARINRASFTRESLAGVDILVIAVPEEGFALTPTSLEEYELMAISGFVRDGGGLILAGWSDEAYGGRGLDSFNTLLSMVGSSMRFGRDEIRQGEHGDATRLSFEPEGHLIGSPSVIRRVTAVDSCSVIPGERVQVLLRAVGAKAHGWDGSHTDDPAFAAVERVQGGRVVVLGSPTFSSYDMSRAGYDNRSFNRYIISLLAVKEGGSQ